MSPRPADGLRSSLVTALSRISSEFDRTALERLAPEILSIGALLDREQYPVAEPGQELVYPLLEKQDGPSIYLVSDGPGTSSPPHEHQTWALIAGIDGHELNTYYSVNGPGTREVTSIAALTIGPGEFVVLDPSTIHATSVAGAASTYHLHLYGRSLTSLPPFSLRTYQGGA